MRFSKRFLLASGSPRRKELLSQVVSNFEIDASHVDEELLTTSDPVETATKLAYEKAQDVFNRNLDAIVLGGDTVVAFETGTGEYTQLSKPLDADDAFGMLSQLSGRAHQVITGIALIDSNGVAIGHDVSVVHFRVLAPKEIRDYVATGEPMDKAGAYAVQAGGGTFVTSIEGSRTNVIGLPLELLQKMLGDRYTEFQLD